MKAISLWQPWASLIAIGAKRIETRHWETRYRGQLAIHAAKKWNRDLSETCCEPEFQSALKAGGVWPPSLPFGAIVATVELYDCILIHHAAPGALDLRLLSGHEEAFGNYADGRFAWRLRSVRRLVTPIPYRGAQGLFDVPDDLLKGIS